jgi:hypothetical protein
MEDEHGIIGQQGVIKQEDVLEQEDVLDRKGVLEQEDIIDGERFLDHGLGCEGVSDHGLRAGRGHDSAHPSAQRAGSGGRP